MKPYVIVFCHAQTTHTYVYLGIYWTFGFGTWSASTFFFFSQFHFCDIIHRSGNDMWVFFKFVRRQSWTWTTMKEWNVNIKKKKKNNVGQRTFYIERRLINGSRLIRCDRSFLPRRRLNANKSETVRSLIIIIIICAAGAGCRKVFLWFSEATFGMRLRVRDVSAERVVQVNRFSSFLCKLCRLGCFQVSP